MNTTDYKSLLQEIEHTIAEYTNGNLSYNEALQHYNNLKNTFSSLHRHYDITNYLKCILATHNAKNFTLYSAIIEYSSSKHASSFLLNHGPQEFTEFLAPLLDKFFLTSRTVLDYATDNNLIDKFTVYSTLIYQSKNCSIAFIAISSSKFFSKDSFLFYGSHLQMYMNLLSIEEMTSLDVTHKVVKHIYTKCTDLLSRRPCSLIGIYVISPFTILHHLGIKALLEFSKIVQTKLEETFTKHCFSLAMNTYVCIRESTEQPTQKLEFMYRGIQIPSKIYHRILQSETEIIPSIVDILQFR